MNTRDLVIGASVGAAALLIVFAGRLFLVSYAVHEMSDAAQDSFRKLNEQTLANVQKQRALPVPAQELQNPIRYETRTVEPRTAQECYKETGNVINERTLLCRRGFKQQIRINSDGSESIIAVMK